MLALLIVHPALHDAHLAAPLTVQPAPLSATPFLHEHTFPAGNKTRGQLVSYHTPKIFALPCGNSTRTNTLRHGVIDCPPCVARLALRGAVFRALLTGYSHPALARADIPYEIASGVSYNMCVLSRPHGKFVHVRIHSVPALLIVHPALQEAHFAAPFETQPAPVCATPFSHVQTFTTTMMQIGALSHCLDVIARAY